MKKFYIIAVIVLILAVVGAGVYAASTDSEKESANMNSASDVCSKEATEELAMQEQYEAQLIKEMKEEKAYLETVVKCGDHMVPRYQTAPGRNYHMYQAIKANDMRLYEFSKNLEDYIERYATPEQKEAILKIDDLTSYPSCNYRKEEMKILGLLPENARTLTLEDVEKVFAELRQMEAEGKEITAFTAVEMFDAIAGSADKTVQTNVAYYMYYFLNDDGTEYVVTMGNLIGYINENEHVYISYDGTVKDF